MVNLFSQEQRIWMSRDLDGGTVKWEASLPTCFKTQKLNLQILSPL